MQPRYIVTKAPGVGGKPIPEDEPCLVIRGQDVLAQAMMNHYLSLYMGHEDFNEKVVGELLRHRDALIAWQIDHSDLVKRADR